MKRKTGRKLLGVLLTLAMVLGLFPGMSLTAYAEYVCPLCSSTEIVYNEEEGEWFCYGCYMPFDTPAESDGEPEPVADYTRVGNAYRAGDTLPRAYYYAADDAQSVLLTVNQAISSLGGCAVDVGDAVIRLAYGDSSYLYFRPNDWNRFYDSVSAVQIYEGGGTKDDPYKIRPQYTVSFNSNGGSTNPSSQQVWRGDKVTKPDDPTSESGDFAGWYNGNSAWDFDQNTVDYPITLTAHWAVAVTGVTLNPSTAQTIDVGGSVAFTATVAPDGATDKTVKWSTTGGVTLYSDENCTAGNEIGTDATSTLTVYAKGISAGSATVTATSNADSTKTASCDVTVNEAVSDNPYASLLNTTTVVKFDNKDWYLIENNSTALNAGTVTLLAKECVGASQFNPEGGGNTYSGSKVEAFVNEWYTNNISADAKTAVNGSGMFLLTKEQATTIKTANKDVLKCTQAAGAKGNYWWLCSPSPGSIGKAASVSGEDGNVDSDSTNVKGAYGVRPALQLDVSKVTFNSETKTFATAAPALDPVPYMAWDETSKTVKDVEGGCTDYTVVTDSTAAFEDGKWYVVNGEVSVASRITVTGTTNIILCDGAKLNANEGIALTSGKTLNIYGQSNGTGELTARGGENIAGIGGGNKEHAGNVTIHGGVVYATGGTNGAGIGGGNEGNGGNVTINGGNVTATGGSANAKGIGAGKHKDNNGTLTLGEGVSMLVSDDGETWTAYDAIVDNRAQYMKTGTVYPLIIDDALVIGDSLSGNGWSFAPAEGDTPATLTLTDYSNDGKFFNLYDMIPTGILWLDASPLTVSVTGTNEIAVPEGGFGIYSMGPVHITGSGTLGLLADYMAVEAGGLTISESTVVAYGTVASLDENWDPSDIEIVSGVLDVNAASQCALAAANVIIGEDATLWATFTGEDEEESLFMEGTLVKNAIPGTGWTNVEGTEGKTPIEISEAGQTISTDLRRVQFPAALDPVDYMAWDGAAVAPVDGGCTDYTVVTDSTAAFEDGKWYVVNGEVSVASRITVTGTTNIILCDGAKLNANEGIALTSGKTLNIYGQSNGTGELTARGGENIAGIGGGNKEHAGNVTIHGGVVYANGGTNGAGIGGGNEGNGGNVTINGGKVYATGGTDGAGIGGGNYANGGIVTVNGGTVDAKTIGNTSATSIGYGKYRSNAGSLIVASTHVAYSSDSPITAANKTSATAVQGSGAAMNIARQHYMLVEEGNLHSHSFTYAASGATITATCGAANCGLTSNPTLTIVKPTLTTYGETGKSKAATLTGLQDFNTATGKSLAVTNIKYYKATKGEGGAYTKGDEITTGAPTGAGDYMAEITLSSVKTGAETTGDVAASVGYTIAKAEPTAASPTDLKATYGQTLKDVTLTNPTGNTAGTWSWVDDTTTSVGNAGTNTFKANFTPTDANYNSVGNVDVTVTVSAADPATPTNLKATYGQTLADVTLPGGWAWKDRTTSVGEVGTNSFKADYTATSTNYNSKTDVDVTVTVGKANAVAATVTANSRTYDGTDKPLVNVDDSTLVGGEMQYALGENATTAPADNLYTTSIPAKTDAGTYYVWYKVKAGANHSDTEAKALTVTISAPAPAPSGGGGSSTTATVTIPVSSEDGKTSVNVTVQVSGSTATVTSANVDEVLKAKDVGNVTVNVESLNKTVDEVVLPAALVEKVAKAVADNGNDASGLEIKLPTGTVTFDAQTVATLAQQSNGKDLKVHLDKVPQATLTSAQQNAVKDVNALVVLDAYVTADGKRISDFNGGTATFSVPVKLGDGQTAAGVTAYFVAENGEKTEIPCAYDGKNATGTVEHFSNYVVAYDVAKAQKAEEDAKAVEDTVKDLNALPAAADVKLEDKEAIEKARAAYDALTDEQKAKVPADTLRKLTDAETALKAAEPEPTPEPGKVSYDDLTEAEKKQAEEIASALGVDKDTAAAMVKAAAELGVSMDTVKLSGDALAKMDVDSSDPKGADFGKLTARVTKRDKKTLTLKWTKQKNADGYLIYGNKCGKDNKMKLLKTIKKNGTVSYTQKKLKKGTYYKYMVVAYKNVNGQKMPIAASVVIHVPTKGGKVTVPKSLTVKQGKKVISKLTVKKGKSVTVKVTENKEDKKLKIKTHRKVKFESSNKKIASVNNSGKITGKKKGKATVWAYAQNGIFKAIQVTVK